MTKKYHADIIQCRSFEEIRTRLAEVLARYKDILPTDQEAKILIKPNLNSNMNALTGNTTDLRLLAA
ncbi:MAG: [Fe-S]-binding protein, partial [Candidatus Electrothrix sp. ATG2]|nr:[Fe-S]-binding protein [Candidatus Electrothrix sp. ATG2]